MTKKQMEYCKIYVIYVINTWVFFLTHLKMNLITRLHLILLMSIRVNEVFSQNSNQVFNMCLNFYDKNENNKI